MTKRRRELPSYSARQYTGKVLESMLLREVRASLGELDIDRVDSGRKGALTIWLLTGYNRENSLQEKEGVLAGVSEHQRGPRLI